MIVMKMVVVIILVDGDDGDGGGCHKVRAPSCKELCEKKKCCSIFSNWNFQKHSIITIEAHNILFLVIIFHTRQIRAVKKFYS